MAIKADLHRIMAKIGEADRRNGAYSRWLLTELGNDELQRILFAERSIQSGAFPSSSASLSPFGCRPSRIASTISGAKQVRGSNRLT